jgi:archaellum biogenesis ATPase FlaH
MPYENVGTSEVSRARVDEESSWKPVALKDYYDGLFATPIATMLKRTDGNGLIYTGRVHSIYGESESGKSWVAQIASAECLKSDKKVIYIDFESDAIDIVNRLKSLGVSRANLLQYFTYIRPDGPRDADDPYWQAILESGSAELVIIDGVTESLTMWGGETKDNDAITRWMRIFPRTVATASGAAVVLIDHITKNAETRGRFAIGGQAKLATIDGAAYLVEPLEALSPGRVGSLTMRVTKDRPGFIRKIAGIWRKSDRTQEAAVIMIDSTRPQMQYAITVPLLEDELESNKEFKKSKEIVEFIHNHPGCTRRLIQEGVAGSKDAIGERISDLITGGWIANKGNDRSFILYITDEGKSHFNLLDAQITELKVN